MASSKEDMVWCSVAMTTVFATIQNVINASNSLRLTNHNNFLRNSEIHVRLSSLEDSEDGTGICLDHRSFSRRLALRSLLRSSKFTSFLLFVPILSGFPGNAKAETAVSSISVFFESLNE